MSCSTRTVEDVESISKSDFMKLMKNPQPVIIRGAINDWPAMHKWNCSETLVNMQLNSFEAKVEVECSDHTACFYGDERFEEPRELTFPELLAQVGVHQATNIYLNQCPIVSDLQAAQLPTLIHDLNLPKFLSARLPISAASANPSPLCIAEEKTDIAQIVEVNLWMTKNLSRTNWHYDSWNNLLALVRGRKEVLLCPPGSFPEPHPVFAVMPNHGRTNLPDPSDTPCRCPHPYAPCPMNLRHTSINLMRANLGPGDMLFLPEGWWHQVNTRGSPDDSLALSIAVNFWWAGQPLGRNVAQELYVARESLIRLVRHEQESILNDVRIIVQDCEARSSPSSVTHRENLIGKLIHNATGEVGKPTSVAVFLSLPEIYFDLCLERAAHQPALLGF